MKQIKRSNIYKHFNLNVGNKSSFSMHFLAVYFLLEALVNTKNEEWAGFLHHPISMVIDLVTHLLHYFATSNLITQTVKPILSYLFIFLDGC